MAGSPTTPRPRPSVGRYAVAVALTAAAILSQYAIPSLVPASRAVYGSLVGGLAIVYGIPLLAFLVLVGTGPIRAWAHRLDLAALEGLRWYGLLSLLSLGVSIILVVLLGALAPGATHSLDRPNPVIQAATSDPWFWVGLSFLIGAFEETIFRGFVFGFWRGRTASWTGAAIGSSAFFAGVHLYYATTYGLASILIFPMLFLLGYAFAATYQLSGGNLVVIALLHGAYDASAFLTLVSEPAGLALRYGVIGIGALVALVLYLKTSSAGSSGPPAGISGT